MKTQSYGISRQIDKNNNSFDNNLAHCCLAAIEDYRNKRENGNTSDNPPNSSFPKDGKYSWPKGTLIGKYVYGVKGSDGYYHYEARYDEGPGDKKWMQEKDRNYLGRLAKEGKLENAEPAEFKRLGLNKNTFVINVPNKKIQLFLLRLLKNNPYIKSLSLQGLKIDEEVFKAILQLLASNKLITALNLSATGLTDKKADLLSIGLGKNNQLIEINLSNNFLKLESLEKLTALLGSGALKNLKALDLSNNYIEMTRKDFDLLCSQLINAFRLQKLNLTGNQIVCESHKLQLVKLTSLLIDKSKLTVKEFLNSEFVELDEQATVGNARMYRIIIKKGDKTKVNIHINYGELQIYNENKNNDIHTDKGVFDYVAKKLVRKQMEIDKKILNSKLCDLSIEKKEQIVKDLLDYHPDSPLISHIKTHNVIKSDKITSAPSVLFDRVKLTLTHGQVYLVVNKTNKHSRVIYEWLTDYGQRLIKVAHLTVDGPKAKFNSFFANKGKVIISFQLLSSLDARANFLNHEEYLIAGLPAEISKLKAMDKKIMEETGKETDIKYKWLISGKSQSYDEKHKKIQNCLKWITDHWRADLGIDLKIGIYDPISVVTNLIEKSKAPLVNNNSKHTNKTCLII